MLSKSTDSQWKTYSSSAKDPEKQKDDNSTGFCKRTLRIHLVRRESLSVKPSWKGADLVFTTDIGTPITPRNLVGHFKSKLTEAGLPDIRFNDLRHTTASLLLEKNVHPKIVSELLGHSNIVVTLQTYSHIINPINKVASSEMDEMFGVA